MFGIEWPGGRPDRYFISNVLKKSIILPIRKKEFNNEIIDLMRRGEIWLQNVLTAVLPPMVTAVPKVSTAFICTTKTKNAASTAGPLHTATAVSRLLPGNTFTATDP